MGWIVVYGGVGGCLWESSKTELEATVAGLQNELNETRVLSLKHEEACIQVRNEKVKLEELKELNNRNEELRAKMTENGCLWNTCKANLEGTIVKLHKKLNETKILVHNNQALYNEISREKAELEDDFNQFINDTKLSKEKLAEDRHTWDNCKGEFEVAIEKLQNDLNEARMPSQKYEVLWSQSGEEKNELEKTVLGLQNELDETKILRVKDQELCNVLREENNRLGNKLKQCNDRIGKLNTKIKEEELLWFRNKEDLESRLADVEYEKETLIQEYRALWAHLRDEKYESEDKVREYNDKDKELHAQMREDCRFWEACKAKFEDSVAGLQINFNQSINESKQSKEKLAACKGEFEVTIAKLQNEYNEASMLSHKREDLCSQSEHKKIRELNIKIEEDERLWITNTADLENKVVGLQSEKGILSREYKLLWVHLKDEKDDLENKLRECNDRNKELHAQMREDCRLWEACKENFEDSVAQLGDYNDILISMEDETWSLMSFSECNAKTVENLQTEVQLTTHSQTHLSKKNEELTTENESLKLKLEELTTENESTSASREEAWIQENVLLKQQVHELQNGFPLMKDYEGVSTDDILDSVTRERQLLTSLSETTDKLVEDPVIEIRTVKQEAFQLDQENQQL
ncbi:uncharacterized protein LOC131042602 [Cryptomeria japonica]|uniref:uncharacterized protein LOC131042602 n=1 Tax=Cryptomeria japonica TaxID=3369 RepID=UPI0025AC25FB|nr:uncharacterized protein LOC131042602 [Cryptomeria japonica]